MKRTIVFFAIICWAISAVAQSAIGIKGFAVSYHLNEADNYQLFENKIDTAGAFQLQPGLLATYEWFPSDDILSLKLMQGVFKDATGQLSALTHVGIRVYAIRQEHFAFNIGFGPTLFYRNNWAELPGFNPDETSYQPKNTWEYKFQMLSGAIELRYWLNRQNDVAISFNHIQPKGFTLSIGYNHWLQARKRGRRPCNCPGFH